MDVLINGSCEAYGYLVLLQISLVYMQRPDLIRRTSITASAGASAGKRSLTNDVLDSYFLFARLLGTALSWVSWMLAIFVGHRFGALGGLLFFVVGFGASVLAMLTIPPVPRLDLIGHVISLPAAMYLFYATLLSVGAEAPYDRMPRHCAPARL